MSSFKRFFVPMCASQPLALSAGGCAVVLTKAGERAGPRKSIAPGMIHRHGAGLRRMAGNGEARQRAGLSERLRESGAIDWIMFLAGILMLGLALGRPLWG